MKMKKSKLIVSALVVLVTLCALLAVCTLSASAVSAYDLWVNDTQVTAQNAADVLGDGTVSYDAATNTLTLSGANITECHIEDIFIAGIYAEIADLTVKLVGENRITVPMQDGSDVAVASTENIEISGTGKLWSNSYVVTGAQDVVIKDCEISSDWICLSAMGDVTVEDATISGKAGLIGTGAGDITLKNTNVPDGGNYVGLYTETGDITIEGCNMTIHGAAVDEKTIPIAIGEGGGTFTVKNSVLDLRGNMHGISAPTSAGVFENVSGKIEISGAAAYAMMFGGTVSMKGCDLEISCRATKEGACGICAMQDIGIEDSKLKIDVRAAEKESALCIGGIESPNTNVDVWNSTLELTASGPNAAGIYANNVKLNDSITRIEATALATGKGYAAGIVAMQGSARVNGGVLEVLATGPVEHEGPATVGVRMDNAVLVPEFIEADVKLRGNQALAVLPDLSVYGREYELTASSEVNGGTKVEFNKDNLASIRYFHIHPFYAIYFDANGGTGEMTAVLSHYGAYTLPQNAFTPPTGKVFKGWALTPDGEVLTEAIFTPHADTDLYAIWEDDPFAAAPEPPHTHAYGDEWKSDGENHWKECACGEKTLVSAHADGNENGGCDICGAAIKDGLPTGAVVGIVLGSLALLGGGGFALYWFVLRKKNIPAPAAENVASAAEPAENKENEVTEEAEETEKTE
ncbi:MAG: InlB B-repeat-containing protein, partial [Clostridia bacterium]|nr:InlB B-repeat-containing protein [Clostridia bacterium]MBP3396382.1 InlB B-repeat-containing protein [Clostridia bacterium]